MKQSKDEKDINSRIWYYLLSWNDEDNWHTIYKMFETMKLSELTEEQIIRLFDIATHSEYNKK